MALQWQTIDVPLAAGLLTKGDVRAGDPPFLDIARDVQFEEPGGAQVRLPFTAFSNSIFGGGTLSNCRFLAFVNDELCVFTDTQLLSWNAQLAVWVPRGTHLAVAATETSRFVTSDDQIDCDRAELSSTIVYAWSSGTTSYIAAIDKTTSGVLLSPTALTGTATRLRLVALTTKILLVFHDGSNNLKAYALDPASPGTAIAGAATTILATNANLFYDAVRVAATDTAIVVCRRVTTTAYSILKVTAALAVTAATPGRTCDGPIAVAVDPNGTNLQVIRANGTNIQGDLVSVGALADIFTGQAIGTVLGTPVNQVTVAYQSSLVGGQFRATAFWVAQESASDVGFQAKTNTVDQANVVGTQVLLPPWLGLASRAFDYANSIYAWLVFAGDSSVTGTGTTVGVRAQLQNTYFLYRSDGFLVAKCVDEEGGGFSPSTGRLPNVALTAGSTTYSWCATERRIIPLGGDGERTGYAARAPRDVTFTFDTNEARRSTRLGATLYISGAMVLQYDGTQVIELGFQIYPWAFATAPLGGAIAAGTYIYKCTLRWPNAQSEQERSTTATGGSVTYGAAQKGAISIAALTVTRKTGAVRPPAVEVWRTAVAPNADSPYFLTTSKDPAAVGDNRYVANDATVSFLTTFNENFTDAVLTTKEPNPENGNALEALAPPSARIAIASDTRVFLWDVAGDPDAVWPSLLRNEGEVAAFNDVLRVLVPRAGGRPTALAFNNETLTAFRQTAIYALPGDGLNNLGQGNNYGPARIISLDVGAVSQESVALTPMGTIFKSSKGWYLLTPGWSLQYIGAPVNAFDNDTVLAVNVVESQHHVRILTNARMLTWDYAAMSQEGSIGQWAEWTISDGLHAVMWQGKHVYLTATGPKFQSTSFSSLTYGLDVETAWVKPAGEQQLDVMLRWFMVLGEYRSAHLLRIRVARDYQYDGAGNPVYFDDTAWTPSPTTVGSALQVKHSPSIARCQAFKVRITAVTEVTRASLATNELLPAVATSGTIWNSSWTAASSLPGEMGNRVTMSVAFESGAANSIDVRDHFAWSISLQRWQEDLNNIGVRVVGVVGAGPTVAQLESAISAGTTLATKMAADASPTKTINMTAMNGQTSIDAFGSGAYGSPTGEALKLTGLMCEFGVQGGLKRLPASQKAA